MSGDVLQLQHAIGNRAVSRRLTGSVRPPIVQPKLTVGPADDAYEQEADHVARQITAQTHPTALPAADSGPGRQTGEEEQLMAGPITAIRRREDDPALRLSATSGLAGGEVPAGVESAIQNARGGGRSLGEDVRQPMEDAFGADFSQVRIHSDSHADRLNRSISAAAFTTGKDIFFRQGAFNPAREEGRALLAHELTHVVQQSGGTQAIRAALRFR